MRAHPLVVTVVVVLGLLAAVLVAGTLRRPAPPTFSPSPPDPRPAGDSLVGPVVQTVDASDPERWVYFDFSRGSVVPDPSSGWDLAVNRFNLIVNGGPGFEGRGGVIDLGDVAFDSVLEAPASGYGGTEAGRDSVAPALEDWYAYSFTSHLLTPRDRVYVIRTADGRYARLRLLGYYCPGARPGCITFEYVYQGDGSRDLARGTPAP